MSKEIYRYVFEQSIDITEVKMSLLLALIATQSLHGEAQVLLDAAHLFDNKGRTCVIDGGSEVGCDLNRLFVGFLRREFGEESFQVRRVNQPYSQLQTKSNGHS